mgnify:CR=1 FL=1
MNRFQNILTKTLLCTTLAAPAFADSQLIPPGVEVVLTPTQIGHVFDSVCAPTVPALADTKIILAKDAFGWEAIDLGTDFGFIDPTGAITVSLDGNALATSCEMSVTADLAGDGAELYDSLETHLSERRDGDLPEAEYIDGGVIWRWDTSTASYEYEFIEVEGAFMMVLRAES